MIEIPFRILNHFQGLGDFKIPKKKNEEEKMPEESKEEKTAAGKPRAVSVLKPFKVQMQMEQKSKSEVSLANMLDIFKKLQVKN